MEDDTKEMQITITVLAEGSKKACIAHCNKIIKEVDKKYGVVDSEVIVLGGEQP